MRFSIPRDHLYRGRLRQVGYSLFFFFPAWCLKFLFHAEQRDKSLFYDYLPVSILYDCTGLKNFWKSCFLQTTNHIGKYFMCDNKAFETILVKTKSIKFWLVFCLSFLNKGQILNWRYLFILFSLKFLESRNSWSTFLI